MGTTFNLSLALRASVLTALILAFVLSGCAPVDRSASTFEEVSDSQAVKGCSFKMELGTKNELKSWWGAGSIPVTWEVTWTKNRYWDGSSRADHPAPQGFQGLTQTGESGTYQAPLEITRYCSNLNGGEVGFEADRLFTMRPVITVDGEQIALSEIDFAVGYIEPTYQVIAPFTMINGAKKHYACDVPQTWSHNTPRGLLQYDIAFMCPPKDATGWRKGVDVLVIRNR